MAKAGSYYLAIVYKFNLHTITKFHFVSKNSLHEKHEIYEPNVQVSLATEPFS